MVVELLPGLGLLMLIVGKALVVLRTFKGCAIIIGLIHNRGVGVADVFSRLSLQIISLIINR